MQRNRQGYNKCKDLKEGGNVIRQLGCKPRHSGGMYQAMYADSSHSHAVQIVVILQLILDR